MTLRIERESDGVGTTIRLVGEVCQDHVEELRSQIHGAQTAFDLSEVTLVDIEVVRFLAECEAEGIGIVRCPPFVREWLRCEQARRDEKAMEGSGD